MASFTAPLDTLSSSQDRPAPLKYLEPCSRFSRACAPRICTKAVQFTRQSFSLYPAHLDCKNPFICITSRFNRKEIGVASRRNLSTRAFNDARCISVADAVVLFAKACSLRSDANGIWRTNKRRKWQSGDDASVDHTSEIKRRTQPRESFIRANELLSRQKIITL